MMSAAQGEANFRIAFEAMQRAAVTDPMVARQFDQFMHLVSILAMNALYSMQASTRNPSVRNTLADGFERIQM